MYREDRIQELKPAYTTEDFSDVLSEVEDRSFEHEDDRTDAIRNAIGELEGVQFRGRSRIDNKQLEEDIKGRLDD